MLDVYVSGSVDRISPEAPVPVMRQQRTNEVAGGAANVAVNVTGLGGAVHLVSCVGADGEGETLRSLLGEAGVTFDLVPMTGKPTTVKTRFTVGQHQLLRLDREDPSAISPIDEHDVLRAVETRIDSCRLLILSDYGKGMLTDRVLKEVLSLAKARELTTVVDPKRRDFSAYRGASFIKPNRGELQAATGLPTGSDAEIERAALAVAKTTEANILVTRSEAGISLVRPSGESIHVPAQAREVFDVSGAGDTVVAAFALALASDRAVEEAVAIANLAGGIAVSKPGTAVVLAEEVEAERSIRAEDEALPRGALVTADAAMRLRQKWKRQGLSVGFTNGCFDLIHPGHVSLIRQAAHACDRLIVAINSDASVRRLKGPHRPIQGELARAAVIGAIEQVNAVVVFEEDTPISLVQGLKPDLLVKGADYRMDEIVGADIVREAGGRVMTVEFVPGQSTTRLIAAKQAPAPAR
jgi:D-beta-D-heptose 7-phosphate kinase/D-beta-D-heptose 1-phosphate adenosyltransferase